jgi:hypothetical protein
MQRSTNSGYTKLEAAPMVNITAIQWVLQSRAILVIGRVGLWCCEILRIPFYLDNGSQMAARVSVTRTGRALLPRNNFYLRPWYSFLLEAEYPPPPEPSVAERMG